MEQVYKASAPGRVCLVGEHCDYAKGMSVAVPLSERVTLYGERRDDKTISITSGLEDKVYQLAFPLDHIPSLEEHPLRYCAAAVQKLREVHDSKFGGVDITIRSTLSSQKGLGSSAAVSVATLELLNDIYALEIPRDELAELAYRAEHDVLGIKCGRMDQLVAAYKMPIVIDFRDIDGPRVTPLPSPPTPMHFLVGVPLGTKRALQVILRETDRAYNHASTTADLAFRHALDQTIPGEVVQPFVEAVQQGDSWEAGKLLRRNQSIYRNFFVPVCESFDAPLLYQLLDIARRNNSLGEKWTGAGGVGAFICLARSLEERTIIANEIKHRSPVDVHFVNVDL